jgi:8-oxo-dGTP pyrophosphatase MutT (NUDIX family)
MRNRATAIVVKDNKILLIKRVTTDNPEYFIFPGGGVEEGETIEDALKREVKEELSLDISNWKHLFDIEVELPPVFINEKNQKYFIFRIDEYRGIPEIGGPEKESDSEDNQHHLIWVPIDNLSGMKNLYPEEVINELVKHIKV